MGWGNAGGLGNGAGDDGSGGSGGSDSSKPSLGSMILPGIGGASDLFGLFSGMGQQSAEQGAITQTGNELQSALGGLEGEGGAMVGNYGANAAPTLNSIIGSNPAAIKGYQGAASSGYGAEGGYGRALGASPYPGLVMGAGTGAEGSELSNAAQLENWHGLQPKELGEATTVASDAALSAANTMKAQMGGVPNAGAALEEATNQAAQAGMQTGSQLGAMAQEQELGAKETAGQEYGAVAGQQIGQAEGAGQLYQGAMEGAGQLEGAAAQGEAGLSEQDIQELESALGEEGTMAQAGMGAQEYGAQDWTSMLEGEMSQAANQSNPFDSFASGLMSIAPMFAGV